MQWEQLVRDSEILFRSIVDYTRTRWKYTDAPWITVISEEDLDSDDVYRINVMDRHCESLVIVLNFSKSQKISISLNGFQGSEIAVLDPGLMEKLHRKVRCRSSRSKLQGKSSNCAKKFGKLEHLRSMVKVFDCSVLDFAYFGMVKVDLAIPVKHIVAEFTSFITDAMLQYTKWLQGFFVDTKNFELWHVRHNITQDLDDPGYTKIGIDYGMGVSEFYYDSHASRGLVNVDGVDCDQTTDSEMFFLNDDVEEYIINTTRISALLYSRRDHCPARIIVNGDIEFLELSFEALQITELVLTGNVTRLLIRDAPEKDDYPIIGSPRWIIGGAYDGWHFARELWHPDHPVNSSMKNRKISDCLYPLIEMMDY